MRLVKSCSLCYFGDKCSSHRTCRYYSPIEQEVEDRKMMDLIEKERIEYRKAWLKYIEEDDD